MAKHRTHSIASSARSFRSISAARRFTVWPVATTCPRTLIRIWVDKYEAGAFDEDAEAANTIQEYEARPSNAWSASRRWSSSS